MSNCSLWKGQKTSRFSVSRKQTCSGCRYWSLLFWNAHIELELSCVLDLKQTQALTEDAIGKRNRKVLVYLQVRDVHAVLGWSLSKGLSEISLRSLLSLLESLLCQKKGPETHHCIMQPRLEHQPESARNQPAILIVLCPTGDREGLATA